MKRISSFICVILAFVLCFSLSACVKEGKSAYDIAVENGFVGSEQQWLDSLNGKDGKDSVADTDIDIYELYEAYVEEHPNATFSEFLQSFFVAEYYDTEYAASKGLQSVVGIHATFSYTNTRPPFNTVDYSSAGSGVVYKIVDDYAYIITNYHVVYDRTSSSIDGIAHTIKAYSFGDEYAGKTVSAEFVGGSASKDIALIKAQVSRFTTSLMEAELAVSDITLGERVVAIGNPLAEGIAVSTGVISKDSEYIDMEALDSANATVSHRVLRTDTAINGGNSGGGLFNIRGQLLGIVNAKTVESGVDSMGYAIPISVAKGVVDCVLENNSQKCVLGVSTEVTSASTYYDTAANRVIITQTIRVVETSTTLASVFQAGDIIQSANINGNNELVVTRGFQLSDYLYNVRQGDTVNVTVLRNDVPTTLALTPTAENFSPV